MKAEKLRKQLLEEMKGKASNKEVRRLKKEIKLKEDDKDNKHIASTNLHCNYLA